MPEEGEARRLFDGGLFQGLLEAAPDAMVIVDAEGRITLANEQTEQVFGYRREEIYERPIEILLPERLLEAHRRHRAGYNAAPQTRPMGAGRELYSLNKAGVEFPVEISLSPLQTEAGLLVIAAIRDITERKALQEQISEANKLESLGRMAGSIAHDFNNLLMVILGYAELAQEEIEAEGDAAEFLNRIRTAAEQAAARTRQLLGYARRRMVAFHSVDLNAVARGMEPLLHGVLSASHEVVLALTESVWEVNSDFASLEQALLHLVVYARDAMPDGGQIVIETRNAVVDTPFALSHPGLAPGEYALLTVRDNGPGLPPEVRERLFEPFTALPGSDPNVVLELATCYGLVRQNGGTILVESRIGEGTTFSIYLPRLLLSVSHGKAQSQANPAGGVPLILLVDDEPMVRDVAARGLRAGGYRVLEAGVGAEALELQADMGEEIALLISDVVMPGMSGVELAARMRAVRPELPVLYLSGYTADLLPQQGTLETGDPLLAKPFTTADLLRQVRELLPVKPTT